MGRRSRLKRLRREQRALERSYVPMQSEPFRILRSLHASIQGKCGESSRRCWELLLEMFAHATGWQTDTSESVHLWDGLDGDSRWVEFIESWTDEVDYAKANGLPFSEPFGELLESFQGTNEHLGQFFTPMPVVHAMTEMMLHDCPPPEPGGWPSMRGLDPCCGTGRFLISALVHHDGIFMHGVELDLWLMRCAMLNVRLLAKWTSLRMRDPGEGLKPFGGRERSKLQSQGLSTPEVGGDILVMGGRSIFINGDSLMVDLDYTPNWTVAGWAWKPYPWQDNLKINGFYGSYNQWIDAGRPALGAEDKSELEYDYSMADRPRPSP